MISCIVTSLLMNPVGASLVILSPGRPAKRTQGEEVRAQQGHLAFLESLWTAGEALAVGPTADPSKRISGITILRERDPARARQRMAKDPRIGEGDLQVQVFSWEINPADFGKVGKFMDLGEFALIFVRKTAAAWSRGPETDRELSALFRRTKPLAGGPIRDFGRAGWIYIVRADEETLLSGLKKSKAAQEARIEFERLKWWTSKGNFPGGK